MLSGLKHLLTSASDLSFFCRMNNCTASSFQLHLPSDLCRFPSCHQPCAKIRSSTVSTMHQSANVKHGNMFKTTAKRVVVYVEVRGKKLFYN